MFRIHRFCYCRSSLCKTINQLKHRLFVMYGKAQYSVWGFMSNRALDFTSYCVCHSIPPFTLYFLYITCNGALICTYLQQTVADSQIDVFRKTVKWKELASLPVGHSVHTAVLLGGNVYVGGGFKGSGKYRQCCYRIICDCLSKNPTCSHSN